jgi:hypothetical protein
MREFTDATWPTWIASFREESGPDYKGRLHHGLRAADGSAGEGLELRDVRWNSERTARRTLSTMSVVELRRRLRSALGRGGLRLAS